MKISLIQPRVGYNPLYIHEPLNLGYIAAYLIQNGYEDVSIHIAAFESDEGIVSQAREADIVGLTATSPMMKHAKEVAREIKKLNPKVTVVFGGAHPTALPEDTLKEINIDIVVRGEGERTILDVVKAIEIGEPLSNVDGISFRNEIGEVTHNFDRELIPNIDLIPFPARHLINQQRFLEIGHEKYRDRGAWIFSSRGCPYQCSYCASRAIWTRKWRARSPENIIEEIGGLVREFNVDRINFADDTFTISRERVVFFCQLLREKDWGITWGCNIRVDTIDRELLEIMRSAGCTDIWAGVESGSPIILKELKKNTNLNQVRNVFKWAKEVGLRRRAYMMIGSQSESRDTIQESETLIEEIKPDIVEFSILTPYPGCEDYGRATREGYINDDVDWAKVNLFCTDCAMLDTHYLTREELQSEHTRLSKIFEKLRKV